MSVFNGYLQTRDDRRQEQTLDQWMATVWPPEQRLALFDAWVRRQLAVHLDWSWAQPNEERRIEQCRVYLERLVLEMWRRGWLLDGRRLATHLVGVLERIGRYQREGKVADFWPYFRTTVDRYVGVNAEEIKAEAMTAGMHVGQVMVGLGMARTAAIKQELRPLPELLAQRAGEVAQAKDETLREKLARQRALQASRKAAADQPQLL